MTNRIRIAIDGPAGSGKGTVAGILAEKLDLVNIDTGATYRCVALLALRNGIDISDEEEIIKISENIKIEETKDKKVFLNGEDVTNEIRSKEVTEIVSQISSIVKLRENMVNIQRELASTNNCVMEGRDITTVVLPDAEYKIYLDATLEERANRRFKENQEKGIEMSYEEIYENIKMRDENDKNKPVGALKRTDEQYYVDTTGKSIDEVVQIILDHINKQ